MTAEIQNVDSRIAVYLRRNNVTQEEMANRLSISGVQFGRKRRGEYDWKLSELIRIADVIGITASELLADV